MSMPSSRLLVATSAGSRPSLSCSSISSRSSRASEPWWARTRSSPASSLSRSASRSASRRLLTKTIVRAVRADQLQDARVDLGPDRAALVGARGRAAGLLIERQDLADRCHVLDRYHDLEIERLAHAGIDDAHRSLLTCLFAIRTRLAAAEETGHDAQRTLRRRQPDALRRFLGECLEPLERQRHVCAALGAGEGVDLVDDHPLDAAQRLARLRGEQQVERLGRGDQDVRRPLAERAPLLGRRVAGAHRHLNIARQVVLAAIARRQRDTGERRTKVAVHVVNERLQRRNVEDAQAAQRIVGDRLAHQPIEAPQERGERLARAGGSADQRVLTGRDGRPAQGLGGSRRIERGSEPIARGGRERGERINRRRVGRKLAGRSPGHGRRV